MPNQDDESKKQEMAAEAAAVLEAVVEELIDEIIDLEEYARSGKRVPHAKGYRFKVNEEHLVWHHPTITGQQVLEAANLLPAKDYRLRLKIAGEKPEPIGLDTVVDLRRRGVEKFRAIRQGQSEGEGQKRRMAPVLDPDKLFLDGYALEWEIVVDGSIWVLIYNFPLPIGYTAATVTLAIRLEGGYPITALDMFYIYPRVTRADGKPIVQAEVEQLIEGVPYQRWSRHRTNDNPWTPGLDSLETHVYLVEEALNAELTK